MLREGQNVPASGVLRCITRYFRLDYSQVSAFRRQVTGFEYL
jgi:hypothetical protein